MASWSPARPAVDAVDGGRTFGELHQRSCQLAHALLVKVVPAGAAIGVLAPLGPETIEVVLATALIGARTVTLHPGMEPGAMEARCRRAGVVGLVVAVEHLIEVAETTGHLERLNFAFVLEGSPPLVGPAVALPGASPYEPTLAAYPTEAPEPDGPRLRRVRPHEPPALELPDPAPILVLRGDGTHGADSRPSIDADAVLGCLAMGGRLQLERR